jgi:hypothetical protein
LWHNLVGAAGVQEWGDNFSRVGNLGPLVEKIQGWEYLVLKRYLGSREMQDIFIKKLGK